MTAASSNDVPCLELLLSKDIPIDAQTISGEAALIVAAGYGHSNAVQCLLDHGARARLCDRKGRTALSKARRNGHKECVAILREYLNKNSSL